MTEPLALGTPLRPLILGLQSPPAISWCGLLAPLPSPFSVPQAVPILECHAFHILSRLLCVTQKKLGKEETGPYKSDLHVDK